MKFILRNFTNLFRSNKNSFILTIIGLTVAFVVFFITIIQTNYDFSFDKGFKKHKNLFAIAFSDGDNYRIQGNQQYPQSLKEKYPEIENLCTMDFFNSEAPYEVVGRESGRYNATRGETSPSFIDMFTPEILAGNGYDALKSEGKALIPESFAKKAFSNEDPLGKTIKNTHSGKTYTITAIYKDFPNNSSVKNYIYTFLQVQPPNNGLSKSYVEMNPKLAKILEGKLGVMTEEQKKYYNDNPEAKRITTKILPITAINLYAPGVGQGSIKTTLTLLLIGILILIIAYINYINTSISIAPSRIKSSNVHRILGINKTFLYIAIALEGMINTIIALILALLIIYVIKDMAILELLSANIVISENIGLILIISLGVLIFSFLIGLYPAKYVTTIKETSAFSSSFATNKKSNLLRNTLILIQFITAIALITTTLLINAQNKYMLNYNTGMEKENVLYVSAKGFNVDIDVFAKELKSNPAILDYTTSSDLPGDIMPGGIGREINGTYINTKIWVVDNRFLNFFNVKITMGDDFKNIDEFGSDQIIFNQKFLKEYNLTESIIGQEFQAFNVAKIVGIAEDVNYESLHIPIQPMSFYLTKDWKSRSNHFFVKVSGTNINKTINYIESIWNRLNKNPFEYHFLDEQVDKLYKKESNTAKLISIFALITLLIASMGLYGIVALNIRYKTKEIAIRKVNGATEKEIIYLLNKNALASLVIAFVIAVPIVFFAINKWLENFAYKTPVHWWIFILGGLVVFFVTIITVSSLSYKAAIANPVKSLKSE